MKRAVLIGGNGKIGTYLAPLLCEDGYEVTCVSRNGNAPVITHPAWKEVHQLHADRTEADFGKRIAALDPEIVVDFVCFEPSEMDALITALQDHTGHYLLCGSIWVHGPSTLVPTQEEGSLNPLTPYGEKKLLMTQRLLTLYHERTFPGTIVHPGQIFCRGQAFIGPQGNREPTVWQALKEGLPLTLPNQGLETLHPVHAADVAGTFHAAITHRSAALGEAFHAVGAQAVTLRGYAELVSELWGHPAQLRYQPMEEWARSVSPEAARLTLLHIAHSHVCSCEKSFQRLNFRPSYSFADTLRECLL